MEGEDKQASDEAWVPGNGCECQIFKVFSWKMERKKKVLFESATLLSEALQVYY